MICSNGTVATVATKFFFLVFCLYLKNIYIYKNPHIYCYIFLIYKKRQCCYSDLAMCKHGSSNSALVRHIAPFFSFFFFSEQYSSYSFLSSICTFFFLLYILFYYSTNFIIFLQLLRCQFLISQNKIIKYEIVTNHN